MDGVIRHWPDDVFASVESDAGLPPGSLLEAAFTVPEYEQGIIGDVSYDTWCAATEAALAQRYGAEPAERAVRDWRPHRGRIDSEMVELIASIRPRVPVALLSNAHDYLRNDLEAHGLTDAFDAVICSADVRLAKPNPAIYRYAAEALGVAPSSCFFTDDLEVNVAAARSVGMRAVRFTDVPTLRYELGLIFPGIEIGRSGPSTPAAAPRATC